MKQKLALAFLALGLAIFASAQQKDIVIVEAGQAHHLVLGDNMKVVLLQANEGATAMHIDQEAIEQLKVNLTEGYLKIEPKAHREKTQVYVFVNDLTKLSVGSNTVVQTRGTLSSLKLDVFINSGAEAHLKVKGKVQAFGLEENEVKVTQVAAPGPIVRVF